MKIIKRRILASLVITVLGIFIFISCNDNNESDLQSMTTIENNNLVESKIGVYHNLILKENLNLIDKNTSPEDIKNLIIKTLIKEDSKLFNLENSNIVIPYEYLESTNLKSKKTKKLNFSNVFSEMEEKGIISSKLNNFLNEINSDIVEEKLTNNELLEKVNNLKAENFNNEDKKYINSFVQVFNASYTFWTEKGNENYARKALDCNQQIILADAAGALYGSILGPISSVVQGALFSLLANEQGDCVKQ